MVVEMGSRRAPIMDRWAASLLAVLAAIAWVCLRPTGTDGSLGEFRFCILCSEQAVPDILLNMLLYVPLGFVLRALTASVKRAIVLSVVLSIMIEGLQLFIPGRFSTLVDVFSNGSGATLGALLQLHVRSALCPSPEQASARCIGGITAAATLMLLPVFLLRPSVADGPLYQGWTPELRSLESYGGQILSVSSGERELHRYAPTNSGPDLALRIRFIAGPRPPGLAAFYHLANREGKSTLLVGIRDEDIVVRPTLRAHDLRFAAPDFLARGALTGYSPGDTVQLALARSDGGPLFLEIADSEPYPLRPSAARGWSLLRYDADFSEGALRMLDAGWVALLVVPAVMWAPGPTMLTMAVGAPVIALFLSSQSSHLAPPSPAHLFAALFGLVLGRGIRHTCTTDLLQVGNGDDGAEQTAGRTRQRHET